MMQLFSLQNIAPIRAIAATQDELVLNNLLLIKAQSR